MLLRSNREILARREEDLNRNMEDDIEDLTQLDNNLDELFCKDKLKDATRISTATHKEPKEWWQDDNMDDKDVPVKKKPAIIAVDGFDELDIPFIQKAIEIGKLVGVKNRAYGNAFYDSGKILKILYPNGVSIDQMDDMLAVVRILDKIFRIASEKKALGESPYRDIAGYGILGDTKEDLNNEK